MLLVREKFVRSDKHLRVCLSKDSVRSIQIFVDSDTMKVAMCAWCVNTETDTSLPQKFNTALLQVLCLRENKREVLLATSFVFDRK